MRLAIAFMREFEAPIFRATTSVEGNGVLIRAFDIGDLVPVYQFRGSLFWRRVVFAATPGADSDCRPVAQEAAALSN